MKFDSMNFLEELRPYLMGAGKNHSDFSVFGTALTLWSDFYRFFPSDFSKIVAILWSDFLILRRDFMFGDVIFQRLPTKEGMAYPVPNHEYFKVHLPNLKQVEQIELLPYDEHWWNAYVKMIPKSVKRLCSYR